MALHALLFSKNPETADSLTTVLREAGIRADVYADIFAAMEKGTKQPFACILADWSDQPEAGFLLKRARESEPNRRTVVIAIVEGEPTPDEERENRLDFLIFRPIVADEARAVLAKARQQMQLHSTAFATDASASLDHPEYEEPAEDSEDPNLVSIAADLPDAPPPSAPPPAEGEAGTLADEPAYEKPRRTFVGFRPVCAAVLALAAVFCVWRSRETFLYLAKTREGTFHVLQESVAVLFYANRSGSPSVGSAMTDAQQDAYFTRTPGNANTPTTLGVVSAEITPPRGHLRVAFDFPLPSPELRQDLLPPRAQRAQVPDSLRASAPIAPPVVVTVGPAQMMPVSTPPPPVPQYGEPVHLTEESARALAVHTVDPVYPPEALAQKLQGLVVLQALIGRDGSVQDLKLVRGYFVLGRAAIAAVKQWRFRPYSQNGHALETQTVITINFSYPPG